MSTRYQIPTEPGKKAAILLAGLMHVLLFLFLWMGIRWQNKEPVGVDAEIWDVNVRQAAPKPEKEIPPPPSKLQVEKKPVEQEQDADIAIERAREKNRQEKIKADELKKEEEKKRDESLKDQKKQEQAKIEEQKRADALAQKQRMENIKRLTSQVGGTGDAVKSTGNNRVDPGYAGRIAAKIKSNMVYVDSDNGAGNPTVEFTIKLFPDGSLRGAPVKTKSSGILSFDDAVERAIIKSAPYPADKSGNMPTTIPMTYKLKD